MTEFKKGDRVKIYNQKMSGEKFLEGVAVVVKKAEQGDTFYHVRFESDGYKCERNLRNAERPKYNKTQKD